MSNLEEIHVNDKKISKNDRDSNIVMMDSKNNE
jgi:hypothetical protein